MGRMQHMQNVIRLQLPPTYHFSWGTGKNIISGNWNENFSKCLYVLFILILPDLSYLTIHLRIINFIFFIN